MSRLVTAELKRFFSMMKGCVSRKRAKGPENMGTVRMTQAEENTGLVAPARWDANTSLMNVLQKDSLIGAVTELALLH